MLRATADGEWLIQWITQGNRRSASAGRGLHATLCTDRDANLRGASDRSLKGGLGTVRESRAEGIGAHTMQVFFPASNTSFQGFKSSSFVSCVMIQDLIVNWSVPLSQGQW